MDRIIAMYELITARLNVVGEWLPPFFLRAILAFEYWEAGIMKFNGDNWFSHIKGDFPFPFNVINVDISWFLATWFEILGAVGLLIGLFTRFFSVSLIVLTIVATLAVHWPNEWSTLGELWNGYAITAKESGAGNFKLPLLFMIMLLPLLFSGPGKLSLDHLIKKWVD
ncbi:MAG: DoxX family protein [Gammaproteobacteria bacterium]